MTSALFSIYPGKNGTKTCQAMRIFNHKIVTIGNTISVAEFGELVPQHPKTQKLTMHLLSVDWPT
ncbi:hypothetical protein AU255_03965 [Methyloprofundus sedimenti]|uniref:Uncharacterized protein n=1 Tax=Methyloprofundus sedimenti TaxID=1420851 RepID=A0A1V8M6P7_9GAMM|nr:hypothetical protein [Methyloprofundus sedimenti]OQK17063.1 hypothetical protein AU255_03965 [Methyloprofundus sedimenti]